MSSETSVVLGIDVGGSAIKGAPVDVRQGKLLAERLRIPTPKPSTPDALAQIIQDLVEHFDWSGPVGCAFPAVIVSGVAYTAANVDSSWIGCKAQCMLSQRIGCPVTLLNDADAAGIAEMKFGAGRGKPGLVILLTLGTGIGSAMFLDGQLIPNSEIGHLEIRGRDAEERASSRARSENDWSWKKWGRQVDEYLRTVEDLLRPNLLIIGGGVSKKFHKYQKYLDTMAPVVPAEMRNDAGIVGAALAARADASEDSALSAPRAEETPSTARV